MSQYSYHSPPYDWCASNLHPNPTSIDANVRFFLKQLSPRNVRYIGIQLIDIMGLLDATDGVQNLPRVVALIFAKAIDHRPRAEMYAQLCREIVDGLARKFLKVSRTGVRPDIARRFMVQLLGFCRAQFVHDYGDVRPAWLDAPLRLGSDLLSDEELDRALGVLADRRRALGTLRFMGGLFARELLPAQILAGNIQVLLKGIEDIGDEYKIEALSLLLSTAATRGVANLKAEVPGIDRALSIVEKLHRGEMSSVSVQWELSNHPLRNILCASAFDPKGRRSDKFISRPPTLGSLTTAHLITDIHSIQYPNGVVGPLPELNRNAAQGKFRYDRQFLLQFMSVCTLKPEQLLELDAIGQARAGQHRMGYDRLNTPFRDSADYGAALHLPQPFFIQKLSLRGACSFSGGSTPDLDEVSDDSDADADLPQAVARRAERLLYTPQTDMNMFDTVSSRMASLVMMPGTNIPDTSMLGQVVMLVVDAAADDTARFELYARLCGDIVRHMRSYSIWPSFMGNKQGQCSAAGELFLQYLFNRLCEEFRDKTEKIDQEDEDEDASYWDQHWAAQKAKDRSVGLLKLVGELFKQELLSEHNLYLIFETIFETVDRPREQKLNALCMLFSAVGRILDKPGARSQLDTYLVRVKELAYGPDSSTRMVCIYTDLIDLRERKWELGML